MRKRPSKRNCTDADRHLMKSDGHYIQGYNCQLAVDSDHPMIVALGVSNQAQDVLTAATGYWERGQR